MVTFTLEQAYIYGFGDIEVGTEDRCSNRPHGRRYNQPITSFIKFKQESFFQTDSMDVKALNSSYHTLVCDPLFVRFILHKVIS